MFNIKIKDLNNKDKPRERLELYGVSVLTDAELLAMVLRSGGKNISVLNLSQQILNTFKGFKGLISADISELKNFKNIGHAKACGLLAACEIALRIRDNDITKQIALTNDPDLIYKLVKKDFYAKPNEMLCVISLNVRNKVISKDIVSVGSLNETIVHPREIYKLAMSKNASAIILAHNHPSGDPTPSLEDIKITQRVYRAGLDVGINLIDHLIVTDTSYRSLKSLGLLLKGGE